MKPRILMALPQMPQDPASGAARTAQTALEMAAEAGFEVRALGTTATERGSKADPLTYLQSAGSAPNEKRQEKKVEEVRCPQPQRILKRHH